VSPSSEAPTKQKIGKYPVVKRLGVGAMGEVYEVEDPELGRHVALKILLPEMAANPTFLERFRREAVAMAQVRHPHVLQVYELGLQFKQPFFTMELVDGSDCATYIEQSRQLTVAELARIGMQAAQGLAAAAAVGLVHRDVKPANLLLHRGDVKVSDFGIARDVDARGGLTQSGIVMGTPEYMAPEQALGQPVDPRADLYALGVSLFQLATLRLPFTGTAGEVLQMQVDRPMPHPRTYRPDLSDAFCTLIMRMTHKDREQRHSTYEELIADLSPLASTEAQSNADDPPGALLFVDGPLSGRKVPLPQGEFVIGREVDCQLVLDDPQASRRHAAFVRSESGLEVKDLGSRNGVLVNSARVQGARLRVGDRVQVGSTTFKVLGDATARNTSTPQVTPLHEARIAFLARLGRLVSEVNPQPSLLKLLNELLEPSPELLPAARLMLVRWPSSGGSEVLLHQARTAEDAGQPLLDAIQAAATSGRTLCLSDVKADSRFSAQAGPLISVLCAPLMVKGVPVGALYADSIHDKRPGAADALFFEVVAHLTAALVTS
jgi:serine/threonine protein kinase